ncbi:MAG: cupin domain-containing protein [Thiohalomonadales bacterium]
MSNRNESGREEPLDDETLRLLGSAPKTTDIAGEKIQSMRNRVMQRIDDDVQSGQADFITIRSKEGHWQEIAPSIEKKILRIDPYNNTEAYLLRVQAGAESSAHLHSQDEHCLLLEGDIMLNGIYLQAGDYHFAPRGSQHSIGSSVQGALLYIQTGINTNLAIPV